MELTERIETINALLIDHFGVDTTTGKPLWRVVWSEDQLEKRLVNTTEEGLILLHPIVKEVPKYRPYIFEKFVLERLVYIPEYQQHELPTSKLSYEPIWTFVDKHGNYLPPKFNAAKFVIDLVYAAQGKKSMAKYKESTEEALEKKRKEAEEIYDELFGDETPVTDALRLGYGVVVPNSYDTAKES